MLLQDLKNQNTIVSRGFPIYEFETRFRKIQDKMNENSIDAIFITTQNEYYYFAGITSQFWESPTRPMYLILPAKGDSPIAVIPNIMLETVKKTWVKEIYTWPAPSLEDDGVSLLKEKLKDYKNVGMSIDIESQLRMPLKHLLSILNNLNINLIDSSKIINELKLIKSDFEIQKIEKICKIASKCFNELPERLEKLNLKHITERRAVKEMHLMLLENGADSVKYIVGKSGENGYKSVVDGPDDDILVPGNIFTIDTGAIFDGYFCDFDRNYLICSDEGIPEKNYDIENEHLWNMTECALKVAKPGNRFCDLWKAMVDYLQSCGYNTNEYLTTRMGHSIGIQLTELPSIVYNEETVLEQGMVITIEPYINLKDGIMVHEEVITITEHGNRMLSDRCHIKPMNINVKVEFDDKSINIYNPLQKQHEVTEYTKKAVIEFGKKQEKCKDFHTKFMLEGGFQPTPLYNMPLLKEKLGISEILVKDEGQRFGLKAFKSLGTLFAVNQLEDKTKVLCTMTDGNHGKGLAYAAKKLGLNCVIYVPNNMTRERIDAIEELGGEVKIVDGNYDDAIDSIKEESEKNGWCLVSDTSWPGYEEIPCNIMAGYGTIFREIEEQRINCKPITHVIIQAGVGGLASAGACWLYLNSKESNVWDDNVELIITEPCDSDCIAYNVFKHKNNTNQELLTCVGSTNSIMSGLNCGTPSSVSWPIIRDISSLYVTIGDEWTKLAMREMYSEGIIAGESGAAGIATLLALNGKYESVINENSVILTINTEANTDNESFCKIIKN